MGKDKKQKAKVKQFKVMNAEIKRRLKERDILGQEPPGFLEPEENEKLLKLRQDDLKPLLQEGVKQNIFDLTLPHGPYRLDYSRNGV